MRFDRIISMLGSGWSIRPEALMAMSEALDAVMAGAAPNVEAFAANGEDGGEDQPYELIGNVAVVSVVGTLVKRNSWLSCFNTYSDVQAALSQALDDPRAAAILLCIDSPGGSVDGCQELAGFIQGAASQKPLYAYADGQMTSAAYWISAAAREIAAPPTAIVGSIGVVAVHYDRSSQDQKMGVKRTFVTAGKFKAAANDAEPLSDDGRRVIQEYIDGTYAIFLQGVSENRGLDLASSATWADGKVFLAEPAKQAGLIDHVMNLDAFLERIQAQLASGQTTKGEYTMDIAKFKAEHPELFQQLKAEFGAEAKADTDKAVKAASDNTLALAEVFMSAEDHKRLTSLAAMGATPQQAKDLLGDRAKPAAEQPKTDAAADAQAAAALKALQDAGAKNVDPGKPGDPAKAETDATIAGLLSGMKRGN